MILRIVKILFLLLIFSFAFMQPYIRVFGMVVPLSDFIFLICFVFWGLALIFRQTALRWHNYYWLFLFYFLALFFSAVFSENVERSLIKLLGVIYLILLPILAFNILETHKEIKNALLIWIIAAAICTAVGLISIILFYAAPENALLKYTLSHKGTLPPGNYPRLQATYLNPNMLCNYLNVGLILLLVSKSLGWIGQTSFVFLFLILGFCAALTISPGLGGIILGLGIWFWLIYQNKNKILSRLSLLLGIIGAIAFLLVSAIAPHQNQSDLLSLELFRGHYLEPSARMMTWTASLETFIENPFFGRGLGMESCAVNYVDLSGRNQFLSDAHNTYLNLAAQAGTPGLLAILALTYFITRLHLPFLTNNSNRNFLRRGLGIAFVSAFICQGLIGSYEDARHLWLLIGLILATDKLSDASE